MVRSVSSPPYLLIVHVGIGQAALLVFDVDDLQAQPLARKRRHLLGHIGEQRFSLPGVHLFLWFPRKFCARFVVFRIVVVVVDVGKDVFFARFGEHRVISFFAIAALHFELLMTWTLDLADAIAIS